MVATLVALRWRITVNALRNNIWATIGLVLGSAYALGMFSGLVGGAVMLGHASTATAATVMGVAGAALTLGWMVAPLLFAGGDASLDPRALAAWTAPSRVLSAGLAVAGATGVPGIVTGLVLLIPTLTWTVAGQAGAAVLALILAPAALATCVLAGRIVVVGTGLASSRRGRDLLAVAGFLLVMAVALLPSLLNSLLDSTELEFAGLDGVAGAAGLTPLGWALAAPGYLARGNPLMAAALSLGAVLLPVALVPLWHRVVARAMTTPGRGAGRGRTRAYAADAAAPAVLPWQRRLARVSSGPTAAVAARCLRYWRSDPRYLVQVAAVAIVSVLCAGMIATNYATVEDSAADTTTVMVTGLSLVPGQAPGALFVLAPIVALMCGWMIHDDLAFDSTALWTHLAAGLPGRRDRLGRVLAAAVWQLPLLTGLVAAAGWLTGNWREAPAYFGATLGVYGVALAWSSLTSVLLPYETNPPGESPMKSRTSGTAFVICLIQALGVLVIGLVAAPVIAPLIAVAASGAWQWGWPLLAGGVLWGGGVAWGGVVLGGRRLDQRYAQVLATIRSWPGHDAV